MTRSCESHPEKLAVLVARGTIDLQIAVLRATEVEFCADQDLPRQARDLR